MGEDGRRGTLERALLSVLNQEGVAARPVVVITGGRPDPAAELASSYRAKVHIVGEPASPGRALGIGRKLTDARFYAFLDDDDELLPHALGTRLGIMRAEPAVDVVVTTGYWLSGGQRRIHIPDITRHQDDSLNGIIERCWLTSCGGLFRASAISRDHFDGLRGFVRTMGVIVLIGLPIPIGIALTAPRIVAVLLGPNWSPAVPLIQVLALYGVLRTLGTSSHVVYLAVGNPRITAILSALRLVVLMPSLIWMTSEAGAMGAAWAMVFTSALFWVVDVAILFRVLQFDARVLFRAMWRPMVAALAMSVAVYYFQASLSTPGSLFAAALQLAAIVAVGAAIYVTAGMALWRACLSPQGAESVLYSMLRRTRAFR